MLICRSLFYAVAPAAPLLLPPVAAWSYSGWSALPQVIQVCSKLHLLLKAQTPLLFYRRQISRPEDPTRRVRHLFRHLVRVLGRDTAAWWRGLLFITEQNSRQVG